MRNIVTGFIIAVSVVAILFNTYSENEVITSETENINITESAASTSVEVFFSRVWEGNMETAKKDPQNIDKKLAEKIRKSKKSIYAALHELDSTVITDAFLDAGKKGVDIKLVTETDYADEDSIEILIEEGIPVVEDNKKGSLMHNKFLIIDNEYVWTGSMNTTFNGANKNNNNGIFIKSKQLAKIYLDEFNEMYEQNIFGSASDDEPAAKVVELEDKTQILALFSPDNKVVKFITDEIKTAKKQVRFSAFSFTHDQIGNSMIAKSKEGVSVKGLFEKRGSETKYSEFPKMKKAGLDVRQDKNKFINHHKFIVIDDKTVITGSFNFSKNAEQKNDENLLIIRNNKKVADAFLQEFEKTFN